MDRQDCPRGAPELSPRSMAGSARGRGRKVASGKRLGPPWCPTCGWHLAASRQRRGEEDLTLALVIIFGCLTAVTKCLLCTRPRVRPRNNSIGEGLIVSSRLTVQQGTVARTGLAGTVGLQGEGRGQLYLKSSEWVWMDCRGWGQHPRFGGKVGRELSGQLRARQ